MLYQLFIAALFLLAPDCQPTFAQATTSKILYVEPTATVADLFSATDQDDATVYLPDCRYFRFSYDKQRPQKESLFYATNTCRIPLQSFIQLIKKGHTLFQDSKTRFAYKKAVNTACHAQRQAHYKPTPKTLERLATAKKTMLELLKTLPLSDTKIRTSLEKILSIKPKSLGQQLGRPFRTVLKGIGYVSAGFLWVFSCLGGGAILLEDGRDGGTVGALTGICVGVGTLITFGLYHAWKKLSRDSITSKEVVDLFTLEEEQPITIQIELKPTANITLSPEDTLDLTATPSQND